MPERLTQIKAKPNLCHFIRIEIGIRVDRQLIDVTSQLVNKRWEAANDQGRSLHCQTILERSEGLLDSWWSVQLICQT